MTKNKHSSIKETIEASDVEHYLRRNRDFFLKHESLLASLEIPHRTGKAVSLIERQVNILRQENQDLNDEIKSSIEIAREQEHIFELTKRLCIDLLDADDLLELIETLDDSMRADFKASHVRLLLTDPYYHSELDGQMKRMVMREAKNILGPTIRGSKPITGSLSNEQAEYLFGKVTPKIASAAILPLGLGSEIGVLALGSHDTDHFSDNKGVLFLSFISDILERLIPKLSDE